MHNYYKQRGVSLMGLIFVAAILGFLGILGMKIVPTVAEYNAIKGAIMNAKNSGTTVAEIRNNFDKQAGTAYIESITGKDLEITKNGNEIEISFAYDKKIPLVGPASLLIEYVGSTSRTKPAGKERAAGA